MPKFTLQRIKAALDPKATSMAKFISEETFINGVKFSFAGHEYQEYIVELFQSDPNIDLAVCKCSQIGLSEIVARIALASIAVNRGYAVGLCLPSIGFATEVVRTRIGPAIMQSPTLYKLLNRDIDSGYVKAFVNGGFIYALGASPGSEASLVSRPLSLCIVDEIDRCDPNVASGLRSRQTHSKNKPRIVLSTPTRKGVGIDKEMENRQIHHQIAICQNCGHEYTPDYYSQVTLPGFDDKIVNLTQAKVNQLGLDTANAIHSCPECHVESDLSPANRRWVVENPQLRKIGVRLSPFDAPGFITPGDLVTSQLSYSNKSEFMNQGLGLTAEVKGSGISVDNIKFVTGDAPMGPRVSGLDLGKQSTYLSGVVGQDILFVDTLKFFQVSSLEKDVVGEVKLNGVRSIVSDALPLLGEVYRLSNALAQFWPALYRAPALPEPWLFKLKTGKVEDNERVRQVSIQRDLAFDLVMEMLAEGKIVFLSSEYDETIKAQLQSMKRVRDPLSIEPRYTWLKDGSSAADHVHHCLIYLVIASRLISQSQGNSLGVPTNMLAQGIKLRKEV